MTMGAADGLRTIAPVTLVDEVHRQIRELILTGRLRSGEALKDSVLALQMGVSRSPVREALRLLEQSGLVVKSANRSYRIPTLAAADMPELATLRAADEEIAVRTIVTRRIPVDSLDDAVERIRRAEGDVPELAAADAAFHAQVVALAGLPRLAARYSELTDQIQLALVLSGTMAGWGSGEMIVDNHVQLVEALRTAVADGDVHPVLRLWEQHVFTGMATPGILDPL